MCDAELDTIAWEVLAEAEQDTEEWPVINLEAPWVIPG